LKVPVQAYTLVPGNIVVTDDDKLLFILKRQEFPADPHIRFFCSNRKNRVVIKIYWKHAEFVNVLRPDIDFS